MGDDAERIDLSGAELKADPARLADEAAAISMFGGARWILVEQAGDEILPALEALIEAPAAGNPVAIVAGALKTALEAAQAGAWRRRRRSLSFPMCPTPGKPTGWSSN